MSQPVQRRWKSSLPPPPPATTGFSPAAKLAWAPPPMVAHLLIVGLVLSCLVEYGVTAVSYWRDRR